MAVKLLAHDDVAGTCELVDLVPYPAVTTSDVDVTLTPTVDPVTGQTTYDIAVDTTVDINVDNFSYDATTKTITLTETDGTVHSIDVSDLVDTETVTSLAVNGASLDYTDENGDVTNITLCELISALPDNGNTVGG